MARMGLAITVGNPCFGGPDVAGEEYFRREFEQVGEALLAEGVDWPLPETPRPSGTRSCAIGFPYGYLHHLRRAYALDQAGQPVSPVASPEELVRADGCVADATAMLDSHLLCHSDAAGYYVPVPLADPVFLPDGVKVAGDGMVGASQGLLAELVGIAPPIGVRLESDGTLTDAEAARLFTNADDPFEVEQVVWLTLHESCLLSIDSGHPIVFH